MFETAELEPVTEAAQPAGGRVEYGLVINVGGVPVEVYWPGYARIPAGQPLTWPAPEARAGIVAPVRATQWGLGWEVGVDGCARFRDGVLEHPFGFDERRWLSAGDLLTVNMPQ